MVEERVLINKDSYGTECSFEDLKCAVESLTHAVDSQFDEIKNEKWYHRVFNLVTFSQKGKKRMAEQIGSLAQAQEILMEILVRLSSADAKVSDLVKTCMEDIRRLQENDIYLLQRIKDLENVCYLGIRKANDIADLTGREKQVLSGCLYYLSTQFSPVSADQRKYANTVLNYLDTDAEVDNISGALEQIDEGPRAKILTCAMEYMFLHCFNDTCFDECSEFIDDFNLGNRTIKNIKQQIKDTYNLRGTNGFVDKYASAEYIDIEQEFSVSIEGDGDTINEESGAGVDISELEEITISSITHIGEGESCIYKNKIIHFKAPIECEGDLVFDTCVLHYGETEDRDEIEFTKTASLTIKNCSVENHSVDERFFIDASRIQTAIRIEQCTFVNCCYLMDCYQPIYMLYCRVINPGRYFLKNGHAECEIDHCDFLFRDVPEKFKGTLHEIIACWQLHLSESLVRSEEYFYLGGRRIYPEQILKAGKCHIDHCEFWGVRNCIAIGECGRISLSTFNRCEEIVSSSWGAWDSVCIEDCRFDYCTGRFGTDSIINSRAGTKIMHCQFNGCSNNIISASYDGGVRVEYCEFNNWEAGKQLTIRGETTDFDGAMLSFAKSKDRDSRGSIVSNCIFNGIRARGAFAIMGKINEKIDDYAASIRCCSFKNCTTRRESGKIIKEYGAYWPLLGREQKYIKIIDIDEPSCIGWNSVSTSNGIADSVEPRLMDGAGNLIGLSLPQKISGADIVGAPGGLDTETEENAACSQSLKRLFRLS